MSSTEPKHYCINKEKIQRLENALFGDEILKEKGIKEKVDEMHKLLTEGNAIRKFMVWMFSASMGLVGTIYMIYKFYKETKKD